jgi:Protein of unknown function (DUF2281)
MNQTIFEQIDRLPTHLQQKVALFVTSLTKQRDLKKGVRLTQNWGGGMKAYRNQYTSLELQQETVNQWTDECIS